MKRDTANKIDERDASGCSCDDKNGSGGSCSCGTARKRASDTASDLPTFNFHAMNATNR